MMDYLNPLITLVAAFAGAWFAFLFEARTKKAEEKKAIQSSANRALFSLGSMWNQLKTFRSKVIGNHENSDDAWLNMPVDYGAYLENKQKLYELDFLLQNYPNLYQELHSQEINFNSLVNLVKERDRLIINVVHPSLANNSIYIGSKTNEQELVKFIGADTVNKLKFLTEEIIKHSNLNIESLKSNHLKLHAAMKEIYPDLKFVKIDFN